MPLAIGDYALIGDGRTAALVGWDGSIDWWCVPRFHSGACFAALLGGPEHGRWSLAPSSGARVGRRHYRDDTPVLETGLDVDDRAVRLLDAIPLASRPQAIVRIVEGLRGRVRMRMELVIRCDYGAIVPWVCKIDGATLATASPDTLELRTPVPTRGEGLKTIAEFDVDAGDRIPATSRWR